MSEHHIPKGVGLDTLREILAGWAEAGADESPRYTADVEERTSVSDVVGRQTRFLEELGVLEPHRQKHRLTDAGATLANALAAGEDDRAREQARALLADWPLTEEIRGVVAENPTDEAELVPIVADLADQDLDAARVESGISTLLDAYEWAGLLERDGEGRYRLPEEGDADTGSAGAASHADEEAGDASATATAVDGGEPGGTDEPAAEATAGDTLEGAAEQVVAEAARAAARDAAEEVAREVAESEAEAVAESVAEDVVREAAEPDGSGSEASEGEGDSGGGADDEATNEPVDEGTESEAESPAEVPPEVARAVDELSEAAEEARDAAEQARTAAEGAREAAAAQSTNAADPSQGHAVSLDLDVDADDLEAIVRGIKEGLSADAE